MKKKYVYQLNPIVLLTTEKPLAGITTPSGKWSNEWVNKEQEYLNNRNKVLEAVKKIFGEPLIIRIGDYELELGGFTDSDGLIGFKVEDEEK